MSEEIKNQNSLFELFAGSQLTLSEAEEKAKQEAGRPKVERFRIGEDGEYLIRILPLAPELDENKNPKLTGRKGWEYPLHQLFLRIVLPAKKGGKAKSINIPVIRATDKSIGMSIDLIDKYVSIAKELYGDDEDLMKMVTGNSFGGGLRWSYQHALYVLDLSSDKERAKGPQLWQCSHSQYTTIRDAELRLWKENIEDGEKQDCSPVAWFENAYPVKAIRKTDKKTEYTFEIARKTNDVTGNEVETLLDAPRIPELIYRFTRYQLEAEIVFLQQYDEQHQMNVCKEADFQEAIETLKGELPADDNSHFDLANAEQGKNKESVEVTIDSLWAEYDKIADEGLSERSDEYQELREKIRQFAEDNDLDVRLSRSKNNKQLLEEIEEAYEDQQKEIKNTDKAKAGVDERGDEDGETSKSAHRTYDDDGVDGDKEEEKQSAPARRRRPRPSADDEEDHPSKPDDKGEGEDDSTKDKAESDGVDDKEDGQADRQLHRRRRR